MDRKKIRERNDYIKNTVILNGVTVFFLSTKIERIRRNYIFLPIRFHILAFIFYKKLFLFLKSGRAPPIQSEFHFIKNNFRLEKRTMKNNKNNDNTKMSITYNFVSDEKSEISVDVLVKQEGLTADEAIKFCELIKEMDDKDKNNERTETRRHVSLSKFNDDIQAPKAFEEQIVNEKYGYCSNQ